MKHFVLYYNYPDILASPNLTSHSIVYLVLRVSWLQYFNIIFKVFRYQIK